MQYPIMVIIGYCKGRSRLGETSLLSSSAKDVLLKRLDKLWPDYQPSPKTDVTLNLPQVPFSTEV